jgi:hypothetical protein
MSNVPIVTNPSKARILQISSLLALAAGTTLLLHPSLPVIGTAVIGGLGATIRKSVEFAAHAAVLFVMTALLLAAMPRSVLTTTTTLLSLVAFSILSEAAQSWMPHRSVDSRDALCNLAGVGVAAWLALKPNSQKTIAARSSVLGPRV